MAKRTTGPSVADDTPLHLADDVPLVPQEAPVLVVGLIGNLHSAAELCRHGEHAVEVDDRVVADLEEVHAVAHASVLRLERRVRGQGFEAAHVTFTREVAQELKVEVPWSVRSPASLSKKG